MIRSWVRRLGALCFSVALTWVMLELLLRLAALGGVEPPQPRVVAIHERHGKQVDVPHHRYEPGPRSKKPGFKILVVGDSFTWGAGVYHYDIYAERLKVLLERLEPNLRVDLELVSRPGWNTYQENRVVRKYARRIDPDLVVLGYCLNDAEPVMRETQVDIREPLHRREPRRWTSRLLHRYSRIYRVLWERIENTRQRRAYDFYYHELYRRPGWQATRTALAQLRQLAEELDVPLVAVVFPIFDQQLDAGYSYRNLHRTVVDELGRLEIPALDLLGAYEGIDARRLAVEPFMDPHPNELAHRIASQALTHYLVSEGLVPIAPERLGLIELSLPPEREGSPTRG